MTFDLFYDKVSVPTRNVEKSFSKNVVKTNGWNLQFMIKVVKLVIYSQNFIPCGYLPLPQGFFEIAC